MRIHTSHTRDAALRQLHRINSWLIAGSIALTGVFAEAAVHAFPGRTTKAASAGDGNKSGVHTGGSSKTSTDPLQPPAHAPQAASESASAAPAQESTPAQESAPAHEAAPPAEESTPVVSGGS
jgi:hypothetical protein